MGKHDKRNGRKLFYGDWPSMQVSDELRSSVAYLALDPWPKLVLLDWLRHYNKASKGDKVPVPLGIRFSFGICKENVSRATFYRSMKIIEWHGFLEPAPHLQPLVPGSPTVFLPSAKWRGWGETVDGKAAAADYRKWLFEKQQTIKAENGRRQRFYESDPKNKKTCSS